MNRWEVRTLKAPTSKREKYIADLAMAAAAGKSLHTYPKDERRAVMAFLKRAGILVPKSVAKPPVDTRAVLLAQVEQKMKAEAAAFVRAVAVARSLYRLESQTNKYFGANLITLAEDKLPEFFKNKVEYSGEPIAIEEEDIPGYNLAFSNFTADLKKKLMAEAGLA